jgi:hypothetical protein
MREGQWAWREAFALCSLVLAVCILKLRMREARALNIELLNLEPALELALPPAVGYTLRQRKK